MRYIIIFLFVIFLYSCSSGDLFEKRTAIPDMKWHRSQNISGDFNITDTSSSYQLFICLRHIDAYMYNNIWLNLSVSMNTDTVLSGRRELTLGSDASGWEGSGLNDIWDVKKKINERPVRFHKAGTYHFTISQLMRDNPLYGIMSAGIRIEKVNP